MQIIIILSELLPAILLWVYIWKKDTQKESTSWLVKAVLWGVVICIPVAIVESGIETLLFGLEGKPSSLWGTTTLAFIVAALPEETFKLLALWMVLRKNPYYDGALCYYQDYIRTCGSNDKIKKEIEEIKRELGELE